jgi:class 3 adenylate cyclase/uncharacterized membrane protein affecting hemolysin expression
MAKKRELFAFRTLRAKFLALVIPLVLISTTIVFGLYELNASSKAERRLRDKLNKVAAIQSSVLAEPMWNVANEQIKLILTALATDSDVSGAVVYDESKKIIGSIGSVDALERRPFYASREITYVSGNKKTVIGRLAIALTDARLLAETRARLLIAAGLASLLLLAVVMIALVANRRTIGIPLERLLKSIDSARQKGKRIPVDWSSRDEIGTVISSFNEMLVRQEAYEAELREARTDLENRVEIRTKELADKTNDLERLSNQLAKYLSPQVYQSIFSGKQEVKVASSRKKLTVLFSDIAGFTQTADRLESEDLTSLLNHYLTEMSQLALDHGATIDKYIGDAILIFFGDPETKGVKEDALACVHMAIAMQKRMHDLADVWRDAGIERPLQCRMGIHTGFCTVGNFGSEDRMDYTIIGGAVNTASRLEALAKPGEILISYETFSQVRDQIHCEDEGEIEVKGIAYPVAKYRVIDTHENLGRERRRIHEDHPGVKLDLDLDSMTVENRGEAETILRRALQLLSANPAPNKRIRVAEPKNQVRRQRR